jgi:hypothetical protein
VNRSLSHDPVGLSHPCLLTWVLHSRLVVARGPERVLGYSDLMSDLFYSGCFRDRFVRQVHLQNFDLVKKLAAVLVVLVVAGNSWGERRLARLERERGSYSVR